MNIELKTDESLHQLTQCSYKIIQKKNTFCFGIDAVLLADFARIKNKDIVADLGTGTGIIPVLLAGKTGCNNFTAIEIQDEIADMAKRTVSLNNLDDRIKILNADIKDIKKFFSANSFTAVVSNPPYMKLNGIQQNTEETLAIARHEIKCSLANVVQAASWLLNSGGNFFMIHKASRLAEIISCLRGNGLEPKRMRLVQPEISKEPNLVLIESRKGAKSDIKIELPLIVYKEKNIYSDEVQKMYFEF